MNVKYENGETAVWNSARQVTWTYTASTKVVSVVVDGDSTSGTKKLDSWGTSRFKENFTTTVTQPWESNTACGGWKPIKGKYAIETPSMTFDVVFGVDANGAQVSTGCAYGLSINWNLIKANQSGTNIVQYW